MAQRFQGVRGFLRGEGNGFPEPSGPTQCADHRLTLRTSEAFLVRSVTTTPEDVDSPEQTPVATTASPTSTSVLQYARTSLAPSVKIRYGWSVAGFETTRPHVRTSKPTLVSPDISPMDVLPSLDAVIPRVPGTSLVPAGSTTDALMNGSSPKSSVPETMSILPGVKTCGYSTLMPAKRSVSSM